MQDSRLKWYGHVLRKDAEEEEEVEGKPVKHAGLYRKKAGRLAGKAAVLLDWYRCFWRTPVYFISQQNVDSLSYQCCQCYLGDMGYADDDGHIVITDRLKELIKFKGLQVKCSLYPTT